MRPIRLLPLLAVVVLLAGCGGTTPTRVPPAAPTSLLPDVVGLSLEDADEVLDQHGIGHSAETYDGDVPLIKHFWEVCEQEPEGGAKARFVELYVDRDCD